MSKPCGRYVPPLGRPVPAQPQRPRADRASQFMPFAALTGYEAHLRRSEAENEAAIQDFGGENPWPEELDQLPDWEDLGC
jgi:hypothetical protein